MALIKLSKLGRAGMGPLFQAAVAAGIALASSAPIGAGLVPRAAAYAGSDAVQAELEQMRNAGQIRALAPAQARYREALAALQAGNPAEATRLLAAAAEFDPQYPDPHFTLAGVLAFRNPERAVGELGEALRIVGRSYPWQRHLLANVLTGFLLVWILSLLLAVAGIALRHLPHVIHIVTELTGRSKSAITRGASTLIALSPLLWGLGPIPTATVYAGLLSFRIGRREAFLVGLFVVSSIALASFLTSIAPWAGPPSLEEPSLLVDRALNVGADSEVSGALSALEMRDPTESLYPFTLGTIARREGDFDSAERKLTQANALRPNSAWTLTNLGNVYFAREDYDRARAAYEAATKSAPNAVEPHFNLAQTYTKQLMFAEANREQAIATALAFDRVRDMSRISAPQLNRTVMEAEPPTQVLWDLARRTAPERGMAATRSNRYLTFLTRLLPPPPFSIFFLVALFLVFAGMGQMMGRSLPTLHCSNCQKVVCRRCVFRMQQRAFCEGCFGAVRDLKSMEFTRLLLTGRDRRAAQRRTFRETATTFLLPGAGQMLRGASLSGFFAILIMAAAGILVVGNGAIIPSVDVLPLDSAGWAKRIPLTLLFALTYALTVARYYAKTTTNVPSMTHSLGRAAGRPSRAKAEGGIS
ncbi:MAG TPA: tetratricopeptide repeat protein [Candidatus Eisenbacteria bacterium]|nr:tetratricopeptide repeat protein [Candidatus Eisenbacteria bacterium]